jgi:hypothetical protein
MFRTTRGSRLPLMAFVCGLLAACAGSDPSSLTAVDPRAGLTQTTPADSGSGNPPEQLAPGYFRGVIVAPSAPGAVDTLVTASPLADVQVVLYQCCKPTSNDSLGVGDRVASTVSDASGHFATPVVPGGRYVVTFVPSPSSGYAGVWAVATAYDKSSIYDWHVVLPNR